MTSWNRLASPPMRWRRAWPASRIATILAGHRAVTAETALRLARHFGASAGFWLNLRKAHEREVAERAAAARIRAEIPPRVTNHPAG